MKFKLLLLLFACSCLSGIAREFTDMAGRKIAIPEKIERVLPYDSKTSILLFPVASRKMVAKAMLPGKRKYKLIAAEYDKMPEVDIKQFEEVLEANPEIIIAGAYIEKDSYERFEKLQKRLGIPVVLVDLSVDKLDKTYLFLGELLGQKTVCEKCASFISNVYLQTDSLMKITSLKDISVYYTIGSSGLMTDPSGSKHSEVLDYLKIPNAAKVGIPSGGHAQVNMEQVIIWNPDYILSSDFKGGSNAYETITGGSLWKGISAVKNQKVFKVPSQPFGCFDHPPSVNRIPGIIWLLELFYLQSSGKTEKMVKEFYHLFYKYELKPEEFKSLFG